MVLPDHKLAPVPEQTDLLIWDVAKETLEAPRVWLADWNEASKHVFQTPNSKH